MLLNGVKERIFFGESLFNVCGRRAPELTASKPARGFLQGSLPEGKGSVQ